MDKPDKTKTPACTWFTKVAFLNVVMRVVYVSSVPFHYFNKEQSFNIIIFSVFAMRSVYKIKRSLSAFINILLTLVGYKKNGERILFRYVLFIHIGLTSCMIANAQQSITSAYLTDINEVSNHFAIPALPKDSVNENPYALVAGGSKGIGYAIAEALAKRKYNLILVARHIGTLEAAKDTLENKYSVHVEILVHDLSKEESAGEIAKWCTDRNIHLKMLCNVAGLGGAHDYLSIPLDTVRYMIRLNIESAVSLTYLLLPLLEKNSPSYILNVASMAGFAPIPSKNIYAATKSAVVFFSYGLRYQLKKKHISVSVLCPGPVFTKPSIVKDTKEKLGWFGKQMAVPPKRVGEVAVKKTLRKKLVITPGTVSRIAAVVIRILPRRLVTYFYSRVG